MLHFQSQKQKEKKVETKKTNRIQVAMAIAALGVLGTILIAPKNAEARRRHWWRYSSTRTSTTSTNTTVTTNTSPTSTTNTTTSNTAPTTTGTNTTTTTPTTGTTTSPATTTTTTNIPFLNNLVGYWKLNGNALGALGKDNGTAIGNVTYVPGKFGQAAHFDGRSYIEIADKDYFSPAITGQKSTFSFWFKPDTYDFTGVNQGYVNFLGKSDWDTGSEWEFRLYNNTAYDGFSRARRMSFYAFNPQGGLGAGSALNDAAPLGAWTHITGVIDGLNTKFYVNGKLVDQDPLSGYNIHMGNTAAPLRIGTADKDSYLKGSLSNVMIFNRNLNDSEVYQLYQADLSK